MWPSKSFIYEINTWVWLNTLSHRYQREITLGQVPDEALDELEKLNIDTIWLMGIWQRNPAGRASALRYAHEYRPVLPDMTEDDIIGSAYAIGNYEVDSRLGGRQGLAALRQRLQMRGIRLILDFVPNHVATDHPWVSRNPVYFVRGNTREMKAHPGMFFTTQDVWGRTLIVAHGRDPYFPSWIDTAQLNAFSPAYRQVAVETLLDITSQCDGVRCDMAMLMLNSVFVNTWGDYIDEEIPETDFWVEITSAVKTQRPDFLFIAEVYWGLEHTLQEQGFDLTYDKTLYDRLGAGEIHELRKHLLADVRYQQRAVRFIENHDEPRAAVTFGPEKSRPAATMICTLPGTVLLHDGQLTGRRAKLPVQIRRQPVEPVDEALFEFYRSLLAEARSPIYQDGEWRLFDVMSSFKANDTAANLIAYGWRTGTIYHAEYRLIVVNLTGRWSQGLVRLSDWSELSGEDWCLHEVLEDGYYFRHGKDMNGSGLLVELKPYGAQIFRFERVDPQRPGSHGCGAKEVSRLY